MRWIICCVIAGISAGSGLAAERPQNAVSITIVPATTARRTYDRNQLPAEMPATQPDEAGVTVSDFACQAEVSGVIAGQTQTADDTQASVKIDKIHIILKLNVTEWMDQLAPQKIWAHEDGHCDIALHFYRHADLVASDIGNDWMGRTMDGSGPDADSAAKNALKVAAQKIADQYMAQVRDQSELVQEAYDRITAHGTNDVDEFDAIQEALDEVAKAKNPAQGNQ